MLAKGITFFYTNHPKKPCGFVGTPTITPRSLTVSWGPRQSPQEALRLLGDPDKNKIRITRIFTEPFNSSFLLINSKKAPARVLFPFRLKPRSAVSRERNPAMSRWVSYCTLQCFQRPPFRGNEYSRKGGRPASPRTKILQTPFRKCGFLHGWTHLRLHVHRRRKILF